MQGLLNTMTKSKPKQVPADLAPVLRAFGFVIFTHQSLHNYLLHHSIHPQALLHA